MREVNGVRYYPGMMEILDRLQAANTPRDGWLYVGKVPPRQREALERRDWAVFEGEYASITRRGQKALATYKQPPLVRLDGICPRCGERPKAPGLAFCAECRRTYAREYQPDGEKPCPRCGERPRHVTASGRLTVYCAECQRAMMRESIRRRWERVMAGEQILCARCGKRPVYVTASGSAYAYCKNCYKQVQIESHARRAWAKTMRGGSER